MGLLKDQRLKLGLTLQNIVDSFGCFSTSAWSSIESGKVRLKSKYFQRCSEILQITLEDLRKLYPLKVCPCGKSFEPFTNNQGACSTKCWHKYNHEVPKYLQKKIDAGLCITCGRSSASGGRKTCQECHDRHMESQRKSKESLAEQGICRVCKVKPVKIKKNGKASQMCKECSKANNEKAKAYYYATKGTATYNITKAFHEFSSWYWWKYKDTENLVTANIDKFIEAVGDLFEDDQCNKDTLYNALSYIMNYYDYLMSILEAIKPSKYNKYYTIEEISSVICVFMDYFVENNVISENWEFVDESPRVHSKILGDQGFYSVEEVIELINTDIRVSSNKSKRILKSMIFEAITPKIKQRRIELGLKQSDVNKEISSYAGIEGGFMASFNTLIKILDYLSLPLNEVCKDIPKPNSLLIL